MSQFANLPDTSTAVCAGADAGPIEVVITDLPAVGTFKGPDMCPPDCGPGPIICEAIKCVEGQDPVSIGAFVDGVLTVGATVPADYVPCSRCAEQVEITTKIPAWLPACFDGCEAGFVCVEDGAQTQWLLPTGEVVATDPGGWSLGACSETLERDCVSVLVGVDGDPCDAVPFQVVRDVKTGTVFGWFTPDGNLPVEDPTAGLTLGVDYLLFDCSFSGCGTYKESCPVEIPGNEWDGVLPLTDVESVRFVGDCGEYDCDAEVFENPSVTVAVSKPDGSVVTQTFPCGESFTIGAAGSCSTFDAVLTGVGCVWATTVVTRLCADGSIVEDNVKREGEDV